MRHILRLRSIPFALCALLTCCGSDGPGGTTDIPTGGVTCDALPLKTPRAPRLLWSCERQAFLTKLHDMNHPMWQELVGFADRSATSSARGVDVGGYAALVYQITGDVKYAQKSYDQAIGEYNKHTQWDANYYRDLGAEYAIVYDWIQGGLSASDRATFSAGLWNWADQLHQKRPPGQPIRFGDTDLTTGSYFGVTLLALATQGADPRADDVLKDSFYGGLDATGADLTSTMRNAIKQYISQWAVGGVWIEGAFYDVDTLQLVGMGVEAVRTATQEDHFPEFHDFKEQVVRAQIEQLAPDLKAEPKWGDLENVRDSEGYSRYQTIGMFTGLLDADSPLLPVATQFVNDYHAQYAKDLVYRSRWYYYFDPTATAKDWRSTLPLTHYASGQGMVFAHDGWDPSHSIVFMHHRRAPMVIDHENSQFGDFQIYRKGAWGVTHPLGYGGGSDDPLAVNSMVIAGLDSMIDRKVVGYTASPDGTYTYFAGTTQGQRYLSDVNNPPPPFLDEWTRSFVYLPTSMHTADTLFVCDRVSASAPTSVDRYQGDDKTWVMNAPHRKQFIVHALVSPTLSARGATWQNGGQTTEVTSLAPAAVVLNTVDEKTIGWPANAPEDSEKHFYVAIGGSTDQKWDTFVDVVQVSDAGVPTKPTRVAAADGSMEGALVARPGQPDAVALCSAVETSRLRTTAFTFTVTPGTSGFDLYVTDLDASKGWTSSEGGDLAVDAGGLSRVTITGGGAHTVTISPK